MFDRLGRFHISEPPATAGKIDVIFNESKIEYRSTGSPILLARVVILRQRGLNWVIWHKGTVALIAVVQTDVMHTLIRVVFVLKVWRRNYFEEGLRK